MFIIKMLIAVYHSREDRFCPQNSFFPCYLIIVVIPNFPVITSNNAKNYFPTSRIITTLKNNSSMKDLEYDAKRQRLLIGDDDDLNLNA